MVINISPRSRLTGVKKTTNFSEDFAKNQREEENARPRTNGGRSESLPSATIVVALGVLPACKTKSRKRVEQAKYRDYVAKTVYIITVPSATGQKTGRIVYMRVCCMTLRKKSVGRTCVSMCMCVYMYICVCLCMFMYIYVCTSFVSVHLKSSSNLIKEREKD